MSFVYPINKKFDYHSTLVNAYVWMLYMRAHMKGPTDSEDEEHYWQTLQAIDHFLEELEHKLDEVKCGNVGA